MFKKFTLSQKFTFFFIIITIGPLLTVAYLGYSQSKYQLEQRIHASEMNASKAFVPLNELRDAMLLLMAAAILLILIALEIMEKIFIRPIMDLRDAAVEVGQGKLNKKLPVRTDDELGELTSEFNNMVTQLRRDKDQLEEQKKGLQKANKELDSFVYTVSHDLRAPLRGIASFAQFLEEDHAGKLDDKGRGHLREIREGARRLSQLIDDLLDLTRISRIKNPYKETAVKELVAAAVSQLKYDIEDNDVELVIDGALPSIVCDPVKIKTVFLNLINNAIKFSSKDRSERSRVEIGYEDTPGAHTFFVKDNGIGIAAEYHEAVFTLFRKLHTNKEFDGTGAGLSIIQRIVEEHGGRIWLESEEGKGASFHFTVPKTLGGSSQQAF